MTFGEFPSGGTGPVASLASLTNADNNQKVPVATLWDGFVVWVVGENAYYRLNKSSGAAISSPAIVQAFGGPADARWIRLSIGEATGGLSAPLRVMAVGNSLTFTDPNGAAGGGGTRRVVAQLLRSSGGDFIFVGPEQNTRKSGASLGTAMTPFDPMCAGYGGERTDQITTRCQPGGTIYAYVQKFGAPDVLIVDIATNDFYQGASAATVTTRFQALMNQLDVICPGSFKIVGSLPQFFAPAAPTGGLVAQNAQIATYIAGLPALIANQGPTWLFANDCVSLTQADMLADGIHLASSGLAQRGEVQARQIRALFAVASGAMMPRPFVPRTAQSMVVLFDKTSDNVTTTADAGWQIKQQNFLISLRIRPTDLGVAGDNSICRILQSSVTTDYTEGWLLAQYNGVSPPALNLWIGGGGAPMSIRSPLIADEQVWLFVHGDYTNGVISAWVGRQTIPDDPASPWVLTMVGVNQDADIDTPATWPAGLANPLLAIGRRTGTGFGGQIDSVSFHTTIPNAASPLPGFEQIRPVLEAIMYEGAIAPGRTAFLPCNEGTGATVASGMAGGNGTLTGGGWFAARENPWPSDEDSSFWAGTLAVVAMADANQTLDPTFYNVQTIEATGALTADRNLVLPRQKGKVRKINNKTTGGKNVVAIGASGTGTNCPAGLTSVYFDGTNFVPAVPERVVTGQFTLNGVTQVDVPGNFPIGATISWSLATVGGTPGTASPYFSAAQTAGHFFVKSPTAGANDVYNWRASW